MNKVRNKTIWLSCAAITGALAASSVHAFDYRAFCDYKEYVSPTLGPTDRLNSSVQDDPHLHCYNEPGNAVHLTYAPKSRIPYIYNGAFYTSAYNWALYYAQVSPVVYDYTYGSYSLAYYNGFVIYNQSPIDSIAHVDLSASPLLDAIKKGEIGTVQSLLDSGVDPNEVVVVEDNSLTPTRLTALTIAVLALDEEIIELLINKGARVSDASEILNQTGSHLDKRTPLGMASHYGLTPIMKMLLDQGADPNSMEASVAVGDANAPTVLMTPLDIALLKEKSDAANLLKQHGGVATSVSETGTPLLYPGAEGAKVGDGISYITGKATLESAIDTTALEIEEKGVSLTENHDDTIKTRSQYTKLLTDTAKVTGSGVGWSVSTTNNFLQSQEYNEEHLIFNVRYMATLKKLEAKNEQSNPIRLTDAALDYLQQNGGQKFLDLYGTHFIKRINLGGSFLGQYNLSFSSSEKKNEFINTFSGNWSNGNQAVGFSNELKRETREFGSQVSLSSSWISFGANPRTAGEKPSTDPSSDDDGGLYALKADFINTLAANADNDPELLNKQAMTAYPWSSLYQIQMLAEGKVMKFTEHGWVQINSEPVHVDGIQLLTTPSAAVVEAISEEMQALDKLKADVKDFLDRGEFVAQKDGSDLKDIQTKISSAIYNIEQLPYDQLCKLTPASFSPYKMSGILQATAEPYMNGLTPVWVTFQQNNGQFDPNIAETKHYYLSPDKHINAITQREIGHDKTFGVDIWTGGNGLSLFVDLRHTRTQTNTVDWNSIYFTPHASFNANGVPVGLPSSGVVHSNVHGGFGWAWVGRPPLQPTLLSSLIYEKMEYGFNGCSISYGATQTNITEEGMIKLAREANADGFVYHPSLKRGAVLTEAYDRSCQSPANQSWPLYLKKLPQVQFQKMDYGFNGCPISYGSLKSNVSEGDMINMAREASADGFIFHPSLKRGAILTEPYDRSCQSPASQSWPLYLSE
ncbi:ankyrin repeat domain-containing protein [Hahella sp. HN01]|uniref:ankyrin repeat domain-containing protein n=1 Tax=Hahella sp. HN01 TaxID=2847262 RepID=UPI001C1EC3EF|nr:ankyrin repeat domain-containing protein [Hahella sp. HN01]MBU6953311.1 ankyrin repeat domain-containing protein [Hahella sp. HN01]